MNRKILFAGLCMAGACFAQNWVIGAGVGYGAYRNATITSGTTTADAGFRNAVAVEATASEDLYEHFSGEFRYVYHRGETFLEAGSAKGDVKAQSHAFVYDALIHFRPRAERIRPFLAGGIGAKYFDTTGNVPSPQPLRTVALLTTQSQWRPVFDVGGGVKVRLAEHIVATGEFRDYIALFPDKLFSTVSGAKREGVLHQFTPMFGIGYSF